MLSATVGLDLIRAPVLNSQTRLPFCLDCRYENPFNQWPTEGGDSWNNNDKQNQPNKQINHKRHEHQKWHIEPKTNHEIYTMRYNWYNQEGSKNYGAKELSHSQEAPGICAEVHLRNMLWETEKRSKQKRHSLKIRCYCYELLLIAHIYSYLIFSNILITPPKEVMGVWFRVSSFQLGGKTKPLLKVYKK